MHAANICTKNYANGKKLQVKTTWRSRLPTQTASTSSSAASRARTRPHVARTRLRSARTYQSAHNR